ncbi:UNVERIFIED_CONTAM: hypothetical protein Sangu_3005500 [Sesamum angustifolium]|uniref:Uncharacterized protein n=1 Tax=Sesamum angustifolium TaxID=2727405 RepID=A0AAW2KQH5_9LAMI
MGMVSGVYRAFTLGKGVSCVEDWSGFLDGGLLLRVLPVFSTTFLAAWASSMLMYLAARSKRASNLEAGFMAKDLKKSPSKSPWENALAFTSWVAKGTSNAATLNVLLLSNNKETELHLLQFSTASKLVQEEGSKFLSLL